MTRKLLNKDYVKDDFPNKILEKIFQYWLKMKGDRLMPSWADLNPADISELLPYISLVDVEKDTGRYRMRLVGAETIKAMGFDITGKYLDDFPLIERLVKKKYNKLVQEKQPYINFDKLKWSRKSFMEYYALGLPMSCNGKDVDILMFGMYYQFPKGKRTEFYEQDE